MDLICGVRKSIHKVKRAWWGPLFKYRSNVILRIWKTNLNAKIDGREQPAPGAITPVLSQYETVTVSGMVATTWTPCGTAGRLVGFAGVHAGGGRFRRRFQPGT